MPILDQKEIKDNDYLSHWFFKKKNWIGKPPALRLDSVRNYFASKGPKKMSVNSKDICIEYPDYFPCNFPDYIHQTGKQQALSRTETKKEKDPEFEETYMGYKSIVKNEIDSIHADDHHFFVEHWPENDNNAHCHVTLVVENFDKAKRDDVCDELNTLYDNANLIKP
jgi:hypothetical protein